MRPSVLAALLASLPQLLAAQPLQTAGRDGQISGACGQPQALTYRLPAPLDTTPMAPLALEILRAEPAYLEIALSAAGRFVARTETAGDEVDPYLSLFDSSGRLLAEDDDAAGSYNALIDLRLEPGTYCVQARRYSGGSDTVSAMTLRAAAGAEAEALAALGPQGGTAAVDELCADPALTAAVRDLAPGFGEEVLQATVAAGSRRDWEITATEASDFQAETESDSFDTKLILVDGNGIVVDENDDGPGIGTNSRVAGRLEPGRYCLSLSGYEGAGGDATLTLTDTPSAPVSGPIGEACTDPALTSDFGTPAAPGLGLASVAASVPEGGRSDWRLEVTEAVTLQIDARSLLIDPVLSLVGADGELIEENDDGIGTGTDSRIVRELAPGTYCLAVSGLGGSGGEVELAVTDEPAPPPLDLSSIAPCSAPDMTASLAEAFGAGDAPVSVSATVPGGSRRDFTLSLAEDAQLRLRAASVEIDTMLRIADAAGDTLAENDDAPEGGTDSLIDVTLASGDYCVMLEGFGGGGGVAELTLAAIDAATAEREEALRGARVPARDSGIAVEDLGILTTELQTSAVTPELTKWVAFELEREGEISIAAVSPSGSFTLRLFDPEGTLVTETEGWAGLTPSILAETLPPGRYMMSMTLEPGTNSRLRNIVLTRTDP